jgi:S-adenosylmethionine:tRNA ribosyltransferase-isomerase
VKDPRYSLETYDYRLPEDRIAKFPLKERDQSKLLVLRRGTIVHEKFCRIPNLLPEKSFLVFNETKVIPARIEFKKASGAVIEIFLLDPVLPSGDAALIMKARQDTVWNCLIRNIRRWKEEIVLEKKIILNGRSISFKAYRAKNLVRFSWDDEETSFGELIEATGKVPLPPYLKREPVPEDSVRYQTIYSKNEGAVAAPTAGLHFTETILNELKKKRIPFDFLTLHVSAGTFQPVRHDDMRKHPMHGEQMGFSRRIIRNLLGHEGPVIAVGTTSMRTLESLYWYGVQLINGIDTREGIGSHFPYSIGSGKLPSKEIALKAVLEDMDGTGQDVIYLETRIYIYPGYEFHICDGLVTNFHMPKSTLLLLVSAFIGENWQKVYEEALKNGYRFLSYGDSSLLIP